MTIGLKPYRGPDPYAPAPFAAAAMPGMPGIALTGSAASEATVQPEPSSGAVAETSCAAGAAADQPGGTDRRPTIEASPTAADVAAPRPPAGLTELTMVPSVMPATPSGATSPTAMAGTAPRVWPSDTAF